MAKMSNPLKDRIPGEPEQLELPVVDAAAETSTSDATQAVEQVREPFEDAADAMYDAGEFSVQPDAPAVEESVADLKEAKAEPKKARQPKQYTQVGFDFQPVIDYVKSQPDLSAATSDQIMAELRGLRDTIQFGIRRMFNVAEASLAGALNRNDVAQIVDSLNKIVHK